jgi:hypothetical protein
MTEIAQPNIREKAIELRPTIDITKDKPVQDNKPKKKGFWDGR